MKTHQKQKGKIVLRLSWKYEKGGKLVVRNLLRTTTRRDDVAELAVLRD